MPNVRGDLALFSGYHSAQVEVDVRLNTNESPYAPPAELVDEIARAIASSKLNRYPDRTALALREAIGAHHGVKPEQVFIANGSNEVISTILVSYGGPGRKAMTFEPTYAMYSQLAKLTSTELVEVERDLDFSLDMGTALDATRLHEPSVIFFCSPNNPTGLDEDPEIIAKLASESERLIVVDEAYGQFAAFDALEMAAQSDNIVVAKTFSKLWSLAGLRLGYLIGPEEVIRSLWATCLPYHLDSLKQSAGLLAIKHLPAMEANLDSLLCARAWIEKRFDELGVHYWKSSANFILFRASKGMGDRLWSELVNRSVLVRNCSGWPRLSDCLRVTVGTSEENSKFIEALTEALLELRS